MALTIIVFILILSLLVFVHELGHFVAARRFGLKPREFGFGFPPRAFGVYKSKDGSWKKVVGPKKVDDAADTIYSVNYVPLGGFVNLGEDDEADGNPDHFNSKKAWQRAIILLAGVSMNIILAAALISVGYMVGLPQVLDGADNSAVVSNEQIQVVSVRPESPAGMAGIELGDVILSVNGQTFAESENLIAYVDEHTGEPLAYVVKRGQDQLELSITPEMVEETGRGGIGVGIVETGLVRYSFFRAIGEGVKTTFLLTWSIIIAFLGLLKSLFTGAGVSADLAGPVGIAALTGQVARMGFIYIVQFAAILSVNLAIINAFPFPALDGGRILFLIIEKIKGSPVRKEIEGTVHNIGFALLMLLVVLVTFRDLARFGDTFRMIWEKIAG